MLMSKIKAYLVYFLNITGLGQYLKLSRCIIWSGCVFLDCIWYNFHRAVHDFFSGFLSLRNDGFTMPIIISKYLETKPQKFIAFITIVTGILVAATFSTGYAALIAKLTNTPLFIWVLIIFLYFLIATLFPVDKIIGKVYPIFGALFLVMVVLITGSLILNPAYTILEFTTQGLYLTDKPIFPHLFVTIACGAISGFHASQSPNCC